MKTLSRYLGFAGLLFVISFATAAQTIRMAQAADANNSDGQTYFQLNCKGCHGKDANGGFGPKLAGRNADYLYTALTGYHNKNYGHDRKAIMEGVASALDETLRRKLAEYISNIQK